MESIGSNTYYCDEVTYINGNLLFVICVVVLFVSGCVYL